MSDTPRTDVDVERRDSWYYDKDPFDCIPVGATVDAGQTKVVGFCSPAGTNPSKLMVNIRYSDGSRTTRDYPYVLISRVSALNYIKKKLLKELEWLLDHKDDTSAGANMKCGKLRRLIVALKEMK